MAANPELVPAAPQADLVAFAEFLQALPAPWALRAADPADKSARLECGTFDAVDEAVRWVREMNNRARRNVYYEPARLLRPMQKERARQEDIAEVTHLHCDVDPRAGEDLGAERERIARMLDAELPGGLPPPTTIVFSGGGYQVRWQLREPILIGGSREKADEAKAFNRQIANLLGGDDKCCDVGHLLRVAGTVNWPDARKTAKGRVPTLATLVNHCPDRVYDLSRFTPAPAAAPDSATRARVPVAVDMASLRRLKDVSDLDEWDVPDRVKVAIVQGKHPDEPKQGDNSRSVWVYDVACNLVRCEVPDEVIFSVLTDPDFGISESVLEFKNNAGKYALRQIERAHEKVGATRGDFVTDKKTGLPLSLLVENILLSVAKQGAELWYDEFTSKLKIDGLPASYEGRIDDALLYLRLEAEKQHRLITPEKRFNDVVVKTARENARHPVREYLGNLHWDDEPRIETAFIRHAGAEDTPLNRAFARLWFIAAVRRIRCPGCKFDFLLVLEGLQGVGKSALLRALAVRDEWFTDGLSFGLAAREIQELVSGKWIVEIPELKGLRRAEAEALKAMLSRTHDSGRPAYGRYSIDAPRQCIFTGTTNAEIYLGDTTGNRRFWPMRVGQVDLGGLMPVRDQLWAEAAHREAAGEPIHLDPSLWDTAATEQAARMVGNPFADTLAAMLGDTEGRIRCSEASDLLGIPLGSRTQRHHTDLGDAMRALGWERTKRRFGRKQPEWCYVKGDGEPRLRVVRDQAGRPIGVEPDRAAGVF